MGKEVWKSKNEMLIIGGGSGGGRQRGQVFMVTEVTGSNPALTN